MPLVYKIFRAEELEHFEMAGSSAGSPDDLRDGFVHLSSGEQLVETVRVHFGGEAGLSVLGVDTGTLGDDLKWEVSRGGAKFPHLFRELRRDDVAFTKPLPLVNGDHDFTGILK